MLAPTPRSSGSRIRWPCSARCANFAITVWDPTRADIQHGINTLVYRAIPEAQPERDRASSKGAARRSWRCSARATTPSSTPERLERLPDGTLGREYARFIRANGIDPLEDAPRARRAEERCSSTSSGAPTSSTICMHIVLGCDASVLGEVPIVAYSLGQARATGAARRPWRWRCCFMNMALRRPREIQPRCARGGMDRSVARRRLARRASARGLARAPGGGGSRRVLAPPQVGVDARAAVRCSGSRCSVLCCPRGDPPDVRLRASPLRPRFRARVRAAHARTRRSACATQARPLRGPASPPTAPGAVRVAAARARRRGARSARRALCLRRRLRGAEPRRRRLRSWPRSRVGSSAARAALRAPPRRGRGALPTRRARGRDRCAAAFGARLRALRAARRRAPERTTPSPSWPASAKSSQRAPAASACDAAAAACAAWTRGVLFAGCAGDLASCARGHARRRASLALNDDRTRLCQDVLPGRSRRADAARVLRAAAARAHPVLRRPRSARREPGDRRVGRERRAAARELHGRGVGGTQLGASRRTAAASAVSPAAPHRGTLRPVQRLPTGGGSSSPARTRRARAGTCSSARRACSTARASPLVPIELPPNPDPADADRPVRVPG